METNALHRDGIKLFYVNPMSYSNLSEYDYSLLSNIEDLHGYYISSSKYNQSKIDGFVRYELYSYSDKKGLNKVISYIASQLKLIHLTMIIKPDIIHCQWHKIPLFDVIIYRFIKAICSTVKIIHTAHNILPHNSGNKFKSIYSFYYKFVDMVITHHFSTSRELIHEYGLSSKNIFTSKHGLFPVRETISEGSDQNRLFNSGKVFGLLGTIGFYKGIDLLVETWVRHESKINQNDINLIIAGAGIIPNSTAIKNNPRVKIINRYLTNSEFEGILLQCDCILLPYAKISQSGMLMKAISNNLPVVVSNEGGLTEPFKYGKVGEIMPEYTVDGLFKAIELVKDNLHNEKYSAHEFELVKSEYSWRKISANYTKLYEELVQ